MTNQISFRRAEAHDVPIIIAMLADDRLGAARNPPFDENREQYIKAFEAIKADPNNELWMIEDKTEVVGSFQLTFIPGLSRKGALRCQIEAVRIASQRRDQGLGTVAINWAIKRARNHGCATVQLTSDATRTDAHRFYERLGFAKSHAGFKLSL
jgi:GNAT superfamily N-acetyltransferase